MAAYSAFVEELLRRGFTIVGLAAWLRTRHVGRIAIIRHDVDRRASKAVVMAIAEAQLGVRTTYYFRCRRRGFPVSAIRRVAHHGHEIGYHYETLSDAAGDRAEALRLFSANLLAIRTVAACETVCMHGAPLSRFDNRTLLAGMNLDTWGLIGDAHDSMPAGQFLYLTDVTGRMLAGGPGNLRDLLPGAPRRYDLPRKLHDLAAALEKADHPVYLSVHPERWATGTIDAAYCTIVDAAAVAVKRIAGAVRASGRS
jgi:hypothetical protein